MTKYSGKTLFLEEQPDGRYTLYNWYHSPIATEELEDLVPIIRAWEPPTYKITIRTGTVPPITLDDLDSLYLNLDDLTGEDDD